MATTIADLVVKIGADISGLKDATKKIDGEFSGIVNAGNKMKAIGGTLSTYVTAPLVAVAAASLKAGIDFESAFAGVKKTVDASEQDLARLERGIRDMAMEIPASAEAIAAVAEAAGQLGIKTENILSFTRTMIDLGEATNLTADQAATLLARFANVTGLPQDQFDRIGSTIVALGNNFATTEAEIAEMAQRLSSAGTIAGVTAPEIMGFAAALTSVGINAEAGGTAFSKLFTEIFASTQSGGEELSQFARVAGMSAQEFRQAYEKDATKAIVAFVEGLGNINKSGGNVISVLDEMGITEIRMRNALLSSAGAGELLADAIDTANDAFEDNNALTKEASERYKTTASQIAILFNRIKELGYQVAQILMPTFKSMLDVVGDVVKWFSELDEGTKNTIVTIAMVAAAVGPLILAIGKVITVGATVITTLGNLKLVFAALTGPIGLTIAAVAALAAAAYAIYDNWGGITDWFEDMWHVIYMAHLLAAEKILGVVESLFGWIPGSEAMFVGLRSAVTNAIDAEEVRRRGQLVERSMEDAAAKTGELADEAESAETSVLEIGTAGTEAGSDVYEGMQNAANGVKSLAEQVRDIMATLGAETEAGKRELAFLVKLDRPAELRVEIEELEQALKALANDTTINIDDSRVIDLQTSLIMARNELDALNAADAFKSKLQTAFRDLDMAAANSSDEIRNVVKELAKLQQTNSLTGEQSTYLTELILDLQKSAQMAEDAEAAFEDMLGIIEVENIELDGLIGLYDTLSMIDKTLSGEDALASKIDAVNKAIEDGSISWLEGQKMIQGYRNEMVALEKEQNSFKNRLKDLVESSFPSAVNAFKSGKQAVGDFKNAFTGENGKPFLENLGNGFHNMANAIQSAKGFMDDFGNAAGLVLGGLDLIVPGLGTAITGLSAVFEQLGIDVSGALQSISNSIANLLGFQGGGGSNPLLAEARKLAEGFKLSGLSQEEIAKKLFEALGAHGLTESMAAAIAGEQFGGPKSGDDPMLKYLDWLGIWDNDGDAKARRAASKLFAETVNKGITGLDGIQKYVFDFLRNNKYEGFGGNLIDAAYWSTTYMPELFNKLIEFGIDPAAGNIPHLAKGGLAFGEMLALVGDNPNASSDPEVVSPLSMLNEMIVQPTLDAVASMMGSGGGTSQYIYVNLDGRVLAESAFYNLPDVVRMNTGGLA